MKVQAVLLSDQPSPTRPRRRPDLAAHDAKTRKAAKTTSIVELDQADQTTTTSIVNNDHDHAVQRTTTSIVDITMSPTTANQTENSTNEETYDLIDEALYHPLRTRINDVTCCAKPF